MRTLEEIVLTEFRYNPETGVVKRLGRYKRWYSGNVRHKGQLSYRAFYLKERRQCVLAHRAAWFLHYGKWPRYLDHVDGDGLNNKINNLRECTRAENNRNRRPKKGNKYKGVYHLRGRYRAYIGVGSRARYLGTFETEEAAARVHDRAARIHHGEFAKLNFPDVANYPDDQPAPAHGADAGLRSRMRFEGWAQIDGVWQKRKIIT